MTDIESRGDIDRLMVAFYERAIGDDAIGYIFTDVAKLDLEHHLPIIGDFWESTLFGTSAYAKHGRNPMLVHKELHAKSKLTSEHFQRWLEIFTVTVEDLFAGERADHLKMRAETIAARMIDFLDVGDMPARNPVGIDSATRSHPEFPTSGNRSQNRER